MFCFTDILFSVLRLNLRGEIGKGYAKVRTFPSAVLGGEKKNIYSKPKPFYYVVLNKSCIFFDQKIKLRIRARRNMHVFLYSLEQKKLSAVLCSSVGSKCPLYGLIHHMRNAISISEGIFKIKKTLKKANNFFNFRIFRIKISRSQSGCCDFCHRTQLSSFYQFGTQSTIFRLDKVEYKTVSFGPYIPYIVTSCSRVRRYNIHDPLSVST